MRPHKRCKGFPVIENQSKLLEKGMGRIKLLMGSPDGPSLMVGKILSSRRGRNGLKVMIVLDIFSFLCLAAQKYEDLSKCKIQVVFTGTVESVWLLIFQLVKF